MFDYSSRVATPHPKFKALGIAPGKYDQQTDAIRLARRLRTDLRELEERLRRLDVDRVADAVELRRRYVRLQMAAVELLGLGFAASPHGRTRVPAALAVSFVRLVEEVARRCMRSRPPDPHADPDFPGDYPPGLVRSVELHLALLEEAAPGLARTLLLRRRQEAAPGLARKLLSRRDEVVLRLCQAVAIKVRSGTRKGPYLNFVAAAVVAAGIKATCSAADLRTFEMRVG